MTTTYVTRIKPHVANRPYLAEINPGLSKIRPYKAIVEPFLIRRSNLNQMLPNFAIMHMMYNESMQPTVFVYPPAINPSMAFGAINHPFNQWSMAMFQPAMYVNQLNMAVSQPVQVTSAFSIDLNALGMYPNQINKAVNQHVANMYFNQTINMNPYAISMNQAMLAISQQAVHATGIFANLLRFTAENSTVMPWNISSRAVNYAQFRNKPKFIVNEFRGLKERPYGHTYQSRWAQPRSAMMPPIRPNLPNKTTYRNKALKVFKLLA